MPNRAKAVTQRRLIRVRVRTYAALFACLQLYAWGCNSVAKAPALPVEVEEVGPAPEGPSESEIETLRALGYVDYSDDVVTPSRSGVVLYDRDRAQPGYNLVVTRGKCDARLIGNDGTILRTWRVAPCRKWGNAELTVQGDLFVPGRAPDGANRNQRYLWRLSWQGSVSWQSRVRAHHDVEPGENEILTLIRRAQVFPEIDPKLPTSDNLIATVDPATGAVTSTISLYESLKQNPLGFELTATKPRDGKRIDMFHANSIERMRRPELAARSPIYDLDNVLVSIRHQDSVVILDRKTGRLVWHWGRGQISGPHDASVLDNGNILLFDNGLGRGWSRVVELNPLTHQIVWEYRAADPEDFYTGFQGSAQRLENGNTLIGESAKGYAFEITPDGEKVWEYWNPLQKKGKRAAIIRIKRYDEAWIESVLRRHRASSDGSGGVSREALTEDAHAAQRR